MEKNSPVKRKKEKFQVNSKKGKTKELKLRKKSKDKLDPKKS